MRYLAQIQTLVEVQVRTVRVFDQPIDAIVEREIKAWLIDWDRALNTKANHHGLLFGVFNYAVVEGYVTTNPSVSEAGQEFAGREHLDADVFGCVEVLVTAGDGFRCGAVRKGDEVVILRVTSDRCWFIDVGVPLTETAHLVRESDSGSGLDVLRELRATEHVSDLVDQVLRHNRYENPVVDQGQDGAECSRGCDGC